MGAILPSRRTKGKRVNQEQNPSDMAKLVLPNGDIDLPIVHATEGYDGVQLGALLKETGTITLDNGYVLSLIHI